MGLVPEHRLAEEVLDFGAVGDGVVELVNVHALDALEWGVSGHSGVDAVLDGDHQAAVTFEQLIHSHVAVREAGHAVNGIWGTRTHQVADLLIDDIHTGDFFDGVTGNLADTAQLFMAVGVFFTVFHRLTVEHG